MIQQLGGPQSIPGFVLRGVNPAQVLRELAGGAFNRPAPILPKLAIVSNEPTMTEVYGTSDDDGVYTSRTKSGTDLIYATSGHTHLQMFCRTGHPRTGGRCDECKQDFTQTALGYPIAYHREDILLPNGKYQPMHTFWVEGEFCTYNEMLEYAHAHRLATASKYTADVIYWIHLMFHLQYPEAKQLRPANSSRLRIDRGGSLPPEKHGDPRYYYRASDFVKLVPAKRSYEQTNNERSLTAADIARI